MKILRIYLHSRKKEKNEVLNQGELSSSLLFAGFPVSSFFLHRKRSVRWLFFPFCFLALRSARVSPLSLSLSRSPALPPGTLLSPGANGLRGQAWPPPMGKRSD